MVYAEGSEMSAPEFAFTFFHEYLEIEDVRLLDFRRRSLICSTGFEAAYLLFSAMLCF